MPKKMLLLVLSLLLYINIIVADVELPEGYEKTEDKGIFTVFNYTDIEDIFGTAPLAKDGSLYIFYPYRDIDREFGILTGNLRANTNMKRIKITNGSYTAPKSSEVKVEITGDFVIDAINPPNFMIDIQAGIYSENGYSFSCESEDCKMRALLRPAEAYLNLSGEGKIIDNTKLEEYLAGKQVSEEFITNVSDLHEIKVMEEPLLETDLKEMKGFLSLSVKPSDKNMFNSIGVESQQPIFLQKSYKEPDTETIPSVYNAVKVTGPSKITLYKKKPAPLNLITENTKTAEEGVYVYMQGHGLLELVRGSIFLTSNNFEEYYKCVDGQGFYKSKTCINIIESGGRIEIKPRYGTVFQSNRLELDMPLTLRLKLPMDNSYNKISVADFEKHDAGSAIIMEKAGLGQKRMLFNKANVIVTKGSWLDFGMSFVAFLFGKEDDRYHRFECNIKTKSCFLDGVKVSKFETQRQISCGDDEDCGEGKFCKEKRCILKTSCKPLEEFNPMSAPSSAIDLLFVSYGYQNEEKFLEDVRMIVDKSEASHGLFSVAPFNRNKDRFVFWGIDSGKVMAPSAVIGPDEGEIRELTKQCTHIDRIVVLSPGFFRSYAYKGGTAYLSMTGLGPSEKGPLFLHEFGHAFGSLEDEYYTPRKGFFGSPGFNCVTDYEDAVTLWGKKIADEAVEKGYRGCGGDCDRLCSNYLRPSENSIMRHYDAHTTYNEPCEKRLQEELDKYG